MKFPARGEDPNTCRSELKTTITMEASRPTRAKKTEALASSSPSVPKIGSRRVLPADAHGAVLQPQRPSGGNHRHRSLTRRH